MTIMNVASTISDLNAREKEIRRAIYLQREDGHFIDADRQEELRAEVFQISRRRDEIMKMEEAHDGNPPQTLQQMPAEKAADRLSPRQEHIRRPPAGLQSVLQRPAADKTAVAAQDRKETASPPAASPVPALQETQMAERLLSTQPPSGPPQPAVQSVP